MLDLGRECTACLEFKTWNEFNRQKDSSTGYRCKCKKCCLHEAQQRNIKYPNRRKNCKFMYRYNITIEDYNKMLSLQEFRCKTCNLHMSEHKTALHVDHNHYTGNIRGILCVNCNSIIGKAFESTDILKSIINYLEVENV